MISELTNSNHDEIISGGLPTVIEFYSPGCVHCRRTEAGLSELAADMSDAVFAKCDIAEQSALGARYDVTAVPTLLFIKDGEIKERLVGFTHKLIIEENIKKLKH